MNYKSRFKNYFNQSNSSKIKRPKFSSLDSSKIFNNFKLVKKSWEDSLKTHLVKNNKINNYEI